MQKETLCHELGHAVTLSLTDLDKRGKQSTILIIKDGTCSQLGKSETEHEISSCYSAIAAQVAFRLVSNASDDARQTLIDMPVEMAMGFVQFEVAASRKDPGSDGERMAAAAPTDDDKFWCKTGWKMGCSLALNNQFDIWHSKLPRQFVFLPAHAKLLLSGMLPIFAPTRMPVPTLA
jgi:hypothetical protein